MYTDDQPTLDCLCKVIENKEDAYLWARYYESGCSSDALDKLLDTYRELPKIIYRSKYKRLGEEHAWREDLLQEGNLGLLQAIQRYDPRKGIQFSTYANHKIKGRMQHFMRDKAFLIRIPAYIQGFQRKVLKEENRIALCGDKPTDEYIALSFGLDVEQLRELRVLYSSARDLESLDQPMGPAEEGRSLEESLSSLDPPIYGKIEFELLLCLSLTENQQRIATLLYQGYSQDEIAKDLGYSANGLLFQLHGLRGALAVLLRTNNGG